ncbi:MAG: hypothetical protein HN383_04845 [Verrucomicrobia bacterium]|jgi:hypothetical protein|nr:hypothetical protein [Verrucomicrobiota bacterium]MBT7700043.1 hypothetical protein [Verrucomicrobiota bacterium]
MVLMTVAGVAELAFVFIHWERAKGAIIAQVLGAGVIVAPILTPGRVSRTMRINVRSSRWLFP